MRITLWLGVALGCGVAEGVAAWLGVERVEEGAWMSVCVTDGVELDTGLEVSV
jgi:hypothetical protein